MSASSIYATAPPIILGLALVVCLVAFRLLNRCEQHVERAREILRESERIEARAKRLLANDDRWPS